jgi:outer membrane receptor protein involved in Fe transport
VRNIVREAFVELGAPLLKDKPFARSLDLNAAVRRTDYSQSGMVSTWKAGFTWEPIDSLRVRYARSRDIRAPNLNDIYFQGGLGISGNLINHIPKGVVGANGSVNLNPAGLANNTSLNTTQNGPSGGGSLLKPEIADTHTFGVVWRQGGFDTSLDYYQITIKGLINTPGAQQVIDGCAAGDARLCQMVTFDSAAANLTVNGGLALVAPTALNLITQTVQGYDFEMGYRMPMLGGNFSVRGLVNYQPRNRSFNPIFNVTTEAANVIGNQPLVGYNLSVGFQKGKWNTDVQIRGFTGRRGNSILYNPDGSVAISATVSNTALYTVLGPEDQGYVAGNAGTVSKNRFAGQYLVNPTVNYKITDKIGAFLAIDNLFDVDPAALSTNAAYDLIGRRYRLGVRAEF